jgi:hypothetical protein
MNGDELAFNGTIRKGANPFIYLLFFHPLREEFKHISVAEIMEEGVKNNVTDFFRFPFPDECEFLRGTISKMVVFKLVSIGHKRAISLVTD